MSTSDGSVVPERLAVTGLSPHDALARWSDLVVSFQGRMRAEAGAAGTFAGHALRVRTDEHQMVSWRCTRARYRRTAEHVRRDERDVYLFVTPRSGRMSVDQDDRTADLGPRRACLIGMDRPFDLVHTETAHPVALSFPRPVVERRLGVAPRLADPIDLDVGLGAVVHAALNSLAVEHDRLSPAQFDAVVGRLLDLLCMITPRSESDPPPAAGLAAVDRAVRAHVRARAADPGLHGASVAQELGWSLRQIQVALQHSGTTPNRLIREERLALAHRLLLEDAPDRTLAEIARRAGFTSAKSLAAAYRGRFGRTPSETRRTPRP